MFSNLKELFTLLTTKQRKKILLLQLLVILMSFAEVVSVLSIGPFMAVVGDVSLLEGQGIMAKLYKGSGFETPAVFLIATAIVVLSILTISTIISMLTMYILCMFGVKVGSDISIRLYKYYMQQPWLFHASGNSNQLINKIAEECTRITMGIIQPLIMMNAKIMITIFISLAILIYNPWVAISAALIFSLSYLLLFKTVRRKLYQNGLIISNEQTKRFKLMGEGFGGIKDTLLMGRQAVFSERFSKSSDKWAYSFGNNLMLSTLPRYIMELIAFGTVIFLVLYLLVSLKSNFGVMLPALAVYALAGFKLLPAFQQMYVCISSIRSHLPAFENMRHDLQASSFSFDKNLFLDFAHSQNVKHWFPKLSIKFKDVYFQYPNTEKPTVHGINLEIPANKVVGIVGASGSGKSTTIDLLLGLLKPNRGKILIDNQSLSQNNLRSWQNSLGFVSQSIFLADASIRENIAFGLSPKFIDEDIINRSVSMAHLDTLVKSLPKGLDTTVGERGVQLSGGERQRIGIARALYNNAEVLVLDEATSYLDGLMEKLIMQAIHDFAGNKTIIIIAHRLATVKKCDFIYLMEKGQIIDKGTYNDLSARNITFQRMAESS
ncbi:MAG: ABC transporter ATP-binding protein [Pseudomonadota bacterium]|nr:ABC transporter ATP-binding protein [Pseudomonadota bacterium]